MASCCSTRAGPPTSWWVLLEGTVALVRQVGTEESVLGYMTEPGQWAGGFAAWDEFGVYFATGRAENPGRVLRLDRPELRRLSEQWFPFGLHFIDGLVNTVRRIESTARQREALVALGTLSAGLAHELNNPASAATRAVDALQGTSEQVLSSLAQLAGKGITAEQYTALDGLRLRVSGPEPALAGLALADREDELSDWLGRPRRRPRLGDRPGAGGRRRRRRVVRRARRRRCRPTPSPRPWSGSRRPCRPPRSCGRSRRPPAGSPPSWRPCGPTRRWTAPRCRRTDLVEGLDSTLVMMGHKLGSGITVERHYAPGLPPIEAMAGELNQVWTNLVDNAIDAMDGTGTLTVSARPDAAGWVVVEVADTGSGMPPEVQAHAFEPFFTTKEVGKGTGLGLDISRRIVVERHSGDIDIESGPGGTLVRVRLPRRHRGTT